MIGCIHQRNLNTGKIPCSIGLQIRRQYGGRYNKRAPLDAINSRVRWVLLANSHMSIITT